MTTGAVTAMAITVKKIFAAKSITATTAIAAFTDYNAMNAIAKKTERTLNMTNSAIVVLVTLIPAKTM